MAACFRSERPGALQGDSAAPKQQDPVPDPAAPVSPQSLRQDSSREGEGQTQDTRPTYLEILKAALPLAAGKKGQDSESTLSEAASAPVGGLSWAELSDDGWSAPDAQPETVAEASQGAEQEPPEPDAMDESGAPDSSDEAEPAAASRGRRRRRHRRKHREEPANEGLLETGHGTGVAANRAVVAWADLGCSLLLGPAGGGATATVETVTNGKAESPMGEGVCSTFSAWSTLVYKPTVPHHNAGACGFANTVPAAGHPQEPWLQFANGFPSYGVLAQQLHTAAPETCANLADLLHAAAPETYED